MELFELGNVEILPEAAAALKANNWRTIFDRPGRTYCLPNVPRTRAEYLETVTATRFTLLNVTDVPVGDASVGFFPEDVMDTMGDVNFCLIILAQKG